MHSSYMATVLVGLLVARLLYSLYTILTSPLLRIPGPWQARFSRLWYLNRVRLGRFEHDNIALHQKYGPIVRVAPNMYSIDDPSVVKIVYGIGSKFEKSDWYEGWKHPDPDRWGLFTVRNLKKHADTRKKFQAMYSMSSLVTYENHVEECAAIFSQRLSEFAQQGKQVNMGDWFQYYAFDVIGDISFSERFGFLDQGEDIDGVMGALQSAMVYSTLVGIFPRAHAWLYAMTQRFSWSGASGRTYVINFVQNIIQKRNLEREKDAEKTSELKGGDAPQDFLEKLMLANREDSSKVTPSHIFMMGLSNVTAGSDTTALSLSGILYYLLKFPRTLQNLRQEIDRFESEGRCENPNVTFKQSQDMPYLQAVMKEALRMHSAVGLPLWRVVPAGGVSICGQRFPVGTVVGVNAWCAHYNDAVFPNAVQFQPERWIEAEAQGGESLKRMDDYYMPFGLGSRTCIGRHISTLEMSKLIPRIIRDFDFELVQPDKHWETANYWFVKPTDFLVKVKKRDAHN